MATSFSVQRSTADSLVILSLKGFLDAHTAPDFEAALQQEIDAKNLHVIIDCSELTYISSAGLGVFMGYIEEVRENGGDIKICGLIDKVRQVFDMLGFDQLFDIENDVEGARQRFATHPTREV